MKTVIRSLALCSLLAAAGTAFGADKVCKLEISGTDQMQYDKKAQAMGHNWVLTKTADMAGVASDGATASVANDHIKPGDARVIAHTKIVGGGESTTITFPTSALKKGEAYSFFCSFPGHSSIMKGAFKFG